MADMFVPVNGIIRKVSGVYVPVNGIIRKVSGVYVPVNGTIREGYVAFDPTLPDQSITIWNDSGGNTGGTPLTREKVVEANKYGYTKLVFTLSVDFTPDSGSGDDIEFGFAFKNPYNSYSYFSPVVSATPTPSSYSTNVTRVFTNEYVNENYPSDRTVTYTVNVSDLLNYNEFAWKYEGSSSGSTYHGTGYVSNMHFEK